MSGIPDGLRQALASRYTIERELGAGGTARVYEADDIRHGRKVAIKVLRPELAAALGPERFLREIETTAKLHHPHILPLYDSGEADGFLYFVMPLVEGETLRSRLQRERQLPVDAALQIAREVADALGYAHSRGVVHRDVKPENILLEHGHALLMDFGITRLLRDSSDTVLTRSGMAPGTPLYMSPEQAAGESATDGRSDLYSLACTLYEMLAGQPPFRGPGVERLFHQHVMETPPPIARFRPAVPAEVAAALQRALAKSPADRFSTMAAFTDALSRRPAATAALPSVAVLPFVSLSADPENEYFADGITEDVIAQLSKIRALKVVSRTSVMPFKQHTQGLREIAQQLQVGAVLEGSVRRAGSRVRIVAQLVNADTDQHLWAETYDRELTDIFAIQSEVALQIVGALRAELSPVERVRIERQPTRDPHAYQLHLQGRHHLIRYTSDSMRKAIEYFERAIAHDPDYAPAFAGIAMALTELGEMGALPPDDAYPRAQAAAARALAIDSELADAHCTVGYARLVYEFDWTGAETAFKRAIELRPGDADAYDLCGRLCSAQERFEEAIVLQRRAQELDPLAHRTDVATLLMRAGRYDEAVEAARHAAELAGDDARACSTLGWALFESGQQEEGLARLERAVELSSGNSLWLAQLGQACALAGRTARARELLAQLEAQSRTRYVAPYHLAYIYTGLGEYDKAVACLEQAFQDRGGAVYGVKGSFLFRPLHTHPGFQALLRRMRLPA